MSITIGVRERDEWPVPVMSGPAPVAIPHPDSVVAPVAIEREPGPDRHANSKREKRLGIVNRPINENDLRLVVGNVDHVRLRGYDPDHLLLSNHLLLRRVNERAGSARLRPQTLQRLHDIGWLRGKRLADLSRPVEVLVHPFHHFGVIGE